MKKGIHMGKEAYTTFVALKQALTTKKNLGVTIFFIAIHHSNRRFR